jgi:hypothetical protein
LNEKYRQHGNAKKSDSLILKKEREDKILKRGDSNHKLLNAIQGHLKEKYLSISISFFKNKEYVQIQVAFSWQMSTGCILKE